MNTVGTLNLHKVMHQLHLDEVGGNGKRKGQPSDQWTRKTLYLSLHRAIPTLLMEVWDTEEGMTWGGSWFRRGKLLVWPLGQVRDKRCNLQEQIALKGGCSAPGSTAMHVKRWTNKASIHFTQHKKGPVLRGACAVLGPGAPLLTLSIPP